MPTVVEGQWGLTEEELDEVNEHVKLGAEKLDELRPGWYARLDKERLSLNSGTSCVLGQLSGKESYDIGAYDFLVDIDEINESAALNEAQEHAEPLEHSCNCPHCTVGYEDDEFEEVTSRDIEEAKSTIVEENSSTLEEYGFVAIEYIDQELRYKALDEAWLKEIDARLARDQKEAEMTVSA